MIDFVEAVKRPLRTDPITIILGILFMIFPPLRPLLHGLGVEAARRTLHHNEHMPKFDDFVDLFLSGLIVYVIGIIYFLPALLTLLAGAVASVPFLFSILQNVAQSPPLAFRSFIGLIVSSAVYGAVAFVLGVLAAVMAPIGVQLYAHDKRIGAAFDVGRVWKVVSTAHYWISWTLLVGYGIVLVGIVTLLSIPEFNALSVLILGAAGYMWWMTWYIMFAETVKESGVLGAVRRTHAPREVEEPKRKLAKKKK